MKSLRKCALFKIIALLAFTFSLESYALIGGIAAKKGEFSGLVQINSASCSGVFITKRHVLTAGHCILRSPGEFMVDRDEVTLTLHSERNGLNDKVILSAAVHRRDLHPSWYRNLIDFKDSDRAADHPTTSDLGIITLAHTLPVPPVAIGDNLKSESVLVTGSGCERLGALPSGVLKWARVKLKSTLPLKLTLGTTNLDSPFEVVEFCAGDSGSPVLTKNSNDDSNKVIAINSTKLEKNQFGVSARVDLSSVQSWIQSIIDVAFDNASNVFEENLNRVLLPGKTLHLLETLRANGASLVGVLADQSILRHPALEHYSFLNKISLKKLEKRIYEQEQGSILTVLNEFLEEKSAPYRSEVLTKINLLRSKVMPPMMKKNLIKTYLGMDSNFLELPKETQDSLLDKVVNSKEKTLEIFR